MKLSLHRFVVLLSPGTSIETMHPIDKANATRHKIYRIFYNNPGTIKEQLNQKGELFNEALYTQWKHKKLPQEVYKAINEVSSIREISS